MATGVAICEARVSLRTAPAVALARFGIWVSRRPWRLTGMIGAKRRRNEPELAFLADAPLTRRLVEDLG